MSRFRLWPSRRPATKAPASDKPVLGVDVDGVVALFGFDEPPRLPGARFELVDGMLHFISFAAGERLLRLGEVFDPVWVTGWERGIHRIEDLLDLPGWPYLTFGGAARFGSADWKLRPLGEYAAGRPLAWIDDSLDELCYGWASEREEPTLLVETESERGLEDVHVDALLGWARSLEADSAPSEKGA